MKKRLKSLEEFQRPWWFPTFRIPTKEQPGPFPWAYLIVGVMLGAGLGWFVLPG